MSNGWFPRFLADGRIISGAGELWLDGAPLNILGHGPVPRDSDRARRIVYHTDRPARGTFQLTVSTGEITRLHEAELIELAAAGGEWAGVLPGVGIVRSDGPLIPHAGQPARAADGAILYRVGDDKIEPSICRTASAWGDGAGRIYGGLRGEPIHDLTVAGPEYRPRLIDTSIGPWLLTMTNTTLRVRPLGAQDGYERLTGENQNLHADAIWLAGAIHVVCNDGNGNLHTWLPPLDTKPQPFGAIPAPAPPQPEPQPQPEPEPVPEPEPIPPEEPPVPSFTPEQLDAAFAAIGVVVGKAFNRDPASAAQGVRQAWDQNHELSVADLSLYALAREGGATPEEVEQAVAAARVLRR